ncbi:unnamed protein product, partial [Linum tenue]
MERYYPKKPRIATTSHEREDSELNSLAPGHDSNSTPSTPSVSQSLSVNHSTPSIASRENELDVNSLKADPGLREQVALFNPNVQDMIRRHYLQKGVCQPNHDFPSRDIGGVHRSFKPSWY